MVDPPSVTSQAHILHVSRSRTFNDLSQPIKVLAMAGYNGKDQSSEVNLAVWVLISVSTLFLAIRLWCRQHFATLWWDDLVLAVSWVSYTIISRTRTCNHYQSLVANNFLADPPPSRWCHCELRHRHCPRRIRRRQALLFPLPKHIDMARRRSNKLDQSRLCHNPYQDHCTMESH